VPTNPSTHEPTTATRQVEGLTHGARTVTEEIFGPVATLHPFSSETEALEMANATPCVPSDARGCGRQRGALGARHGGIEGAREQAWPMQRSNTSTGCGDPVCWRHMFGYFRAPLLLNGRRRPLLVCPPSVRRYGLCSSVWTSHLERAHRVGKGLNVGMVS